jgi:hypothetical protein
LKPPTGKPFVDADSLLDPWGKRFEYDPKGPRNKGAKPDIWSTGPDKADENGIIGNWTKTEPEKRPN